MPGTMITRRPVILITLVCALSGLPKATAQDSIVTPDLTEAGQQTVARESLEELLEKSRLMRTAGRYADGLEAATQAAALAHRLDDTRGELEANFQAALHTYFLQDNSGALAQLEVGLARSRQLGMRDIESMYLAARGVIFWRTGNLGGARADLEASNAINADLGDQRTLASNLNNLGIIAYSQKDWATALVNYRKAYAALGDMDADDLRASITSNIGECLVHTGQLDEAEHFLNESLTIGLRMGDPNDLGFTYFNLGELHSRRGQSVKALALYHQALELQTSIGNEWGSGLTRLRCAEEHWRQQDAESALEELKNGYEALKELNALTLLADYAFLFAEIYREQGRTGLANYYTDLHDWFIERTEAENQPMAEELKALTAHPGRDEKRADTRLIRPVQAATLALLGILIIVLLIENQRLRKHANKL